MYLINPFFMCKVDWCVDLGGIQCYRWSCIWDDCAKMRFHIVVHSVVKKQIKCGVIINFDLNYIKIVCFIIYFSGKYVKLKCVTACKKSLYIKKKIL